MNKNDVIKSLVARKHCEACNDNINCMDCKYNTYIIGDLDYAIKILKKVPLQAEWIYEHGAWQCSNCGHDNPYGIDIDTTSSFSNYCPFCGAKMN